MPLTLFLRLPPPSPPPFSPLFPLILERVPLPSDLFLPPSLGKGGKIKNIRGASRVKGAAPLHIAALLPNGTTCLNSAHQQGAAAEILQCQEKGEGPLRRPWNFPNLAERGS